MYVAGIMVVIARFQWVGVITSTTSITESADESDATAAAAAAAAADNDNDDDDDDDKASPSPHMQYFIQVSLYFTPLTVLHILFPHFFSPAFSIPHFQFRIFQ